MNEDDRITHLADQLSRGVRRRRLERGGYSETEIAREPTPFDGLPDDDQQTWRDTAATVLELFGVHGGPGEVLVQDDDDAIAALEAVLGWAQEKPESIAEGGDTGTSFQRGRVIATRVHPEGTVGISTYLTPVDATQKLIDMERGYRAWLASVGKQPRNNDRAVEEKLGIPESFGGLVGAWLGPDYSFISQVGEGRIQQYMRLTPLNTLQARQQLDYLIAQGKRAGHITDEHVRESLALPPMPPAEYDPDYAPKD